MIVFLVRQKLIANLKHNTFILNLLKFLFLNVYYHKKKFMIFLVHELLIN